MKYNKLTVIKEMGEKVLCKCDCGRETLVYGYNLRDGHTKSCGCLQKERTSKASITHGRSQTKVYGIWLGMRRRCDTPSVGHAWKYYGGRGIRVCPRWEKFENFLEDMGEPPFENFSLDRIDSNGDYFPKNCRWVDKTTQMRNTSKNRFFTIRGETKCLSEWCEQAMAPPSTVRQRFYGLGWPIERALSTPARKYRRQN